MGKNTHASNPFIPVYRYPFRINCLPLDCVRIPPVKCRIMGGPEITIVVLPRRFYLPELPHREILRNVGQDLWKKYVFE